MTEQNEDQPASVPTELVGTFGKVLDEWEEFKKYPVYDMMLQGWWPSLRKKRGVEYITLRKQIKDRETKVWHVQEKSLGRAVPERWEALTALDPHKFPQAEDTEESNDAIPSEGELSPQTDTRGIPTKGEIAALVGIKPPRPSSVLSAKVGKPRVLESTIHPNLETLQWYYWVQQNAGYPGTFEDFINHAVHDLFKEHYKMELAIITEKEE